MIMRKLLNEELNRLSVKEFKETEKIPLILVLDNIRSMNNIGSIFRSADAFLVESIFLCGITATPPHKDIHKTALGATESVHWEYFEETLTAVDKLKSPGYLIISVEQTENSIKLDDFSIRPGQKLALIFGHEIRGIQQNVVNKCDIAVEIPQFGLCRSLNVHVSTAICVWQYSQQHRLAAQCSAAVAAASIES